MVNEEPAPTTEQLLANALQRISALEDQVSDLEIRMSAMEAWADGE